MMRETIPAEELWTKARAVGQYYGFTPLAVLTEKQRGAKKLKAGMPTTLAHLTLDPVAELVSNFLKQCATSGIMPGTRQPVFLWHTNVAPGRIAQKKGTVQFHAFGTDRALADAVVIRAMMALARDIFHEDPVLRINSMGDKETRARYARELTNFFKKRAAVLPEECLLCAKKDVLDAVDFLVSHDFGEELPAPTEHLSDASRKRFEDLLEYLEMTETPYELARTLISRGGVWNDTCFEITVGDRRVAWGSRYGEFAQHFLPESGGHAIGAVMQFATGGAVAPKKLTPRLRFSFVHIGDEAKRLSIRLAEDFHKAHLAIAQHIGVESLVEQLNLAERHGSPYLLIMGRKEALENSAILRDRRTQEEMIVSLDGLVDRLKAIV